MRTRVLPFPSSSSVLAKPGAEGAPRGAGGREGQYPFGHHLFKRASRFQTTVWALGGLLGTPPPAPPRPTWVPEWDWQSQGHSVPPRDGASATFRTPPLPYTPGSGGLYNAALQWVGLELTIHLTSQDPGWGIRQVGGPPT